MYQLIYCGLNASTYFVLPQPKDTPCCRSFFLYLLGYICSFMPDCSQIFRILTLACILYERLIMPASLTYRRHHIIRYMQIGRTSPYFALLCIAWCLTRRSPGLLWRNIKGEVYPASIHICSRVSKSTGRSGHV